MKISINAVRFFNQKYGSGGEPAPDGVQMLVEKIGAQLGAVEEITEIGTKYDRAIIVRIVSCESHPGADRLHVCTIDDGGVTTSVDRMENGLVQVVCGAPNVRAGMLAVWLPPGATVPSSVETEFFVLEARSLRGVISNGMLASAKELALGDSHEGILEVDGDVAPGTLFAEQYNFTNDVIVDIENKMFTHRPDCFGMIGVAREIAGIQGQKFTSPEWYQPDIKIPQVDNQTLNIEIRNELPELVPRFMAIGLSNVIIGPSPVWLQTSLSRIGIRPINNIVDFTNYYMLLTGQPLHAYDYDKVVAKDNGADHATLVVRHPYTGEKLTLLSGKEIEPRAEAIMIATDTKAVGLGGVMGGGDSEIDASTKNIILECASFDMYSIRKTSMAHGIFTDAVTRFNKGQSPLQNKAVLAKIIDDIVQICGGRVASALIDDNHLDTEIIDRASLYPDVSLTAQFVNERLGLQLTASDMATLLTNVEFIVEVKGETLTVRAPFWRTDIEIGEDIVEEIGRLYGYDKLPLALQKRSIKPVTKDRLLEAKQQVRTTLAAAGANELLTYSFVHGNLLTRSGQDEKMAFKLNNALSPELQYYRISLLPGLLDKVHLNQKLGYLKFGLFEIGKTHIQLHKDDDNGLPSEFEMLGFVYAADPKAHTNGAAYYEAKNHLDALAASFGLRLVYSALGAESNSPNVPIMKPYDEARSAFVNTSDGEFLGIIGELRAEVRKNFKLPAHTAGFELDVSVLANQRHHSSYQALPRFPKVSQDVCLRVPKHTSYQTLYDFAWKQCQLLLPSSNSTTLNPVDIYLSHQDADHKQITLRLTTASYDKTMTDSEVSAVLDELAAAAAKDLKAERV